jgi:hypothetical protein
MQERDEKITAYFIEVTHARTHEQTGKQKNRQTDRDQALCPGFSTENRRFGPVLAQKLAHVCQDFWSRGQLYCVLL